MTSALVAPPDLKGSQHPRIVSVPEYTSSTGDEGIELAAMAGLVLDPWQELVLRHSLGERLDGKWAASEVGLVVGRQNGKNAVLEARELAELFLVGPMTGPRLIIHSAHQFATSLEHFRRIKRRILDTPELLKRIKGPVRRGMPAGIRDSHGEESIETVDGSRLLFKARSSSGGQGAGFTCDLLVFDEAWNLPESLIGMVVPTLAARSFETPGVQTWYTSQAVNQQSMPYGVHLARIRERGIAGDNPRLCFAEWSVDEELFRRHPEIADDPAYWALANPGLGVRIAIEHVMWERGGGMPWSEFLAHRLGIGDWPPTSEEAGRVISRETWADAAEHDQANRITSPLVFAIDTNLDQTWSSIGVAGKREDGLIQFAVVAHERGVDWLVDHCALLKRQHPRARFVILKRGPAADKIDELKAVKLKLIEASTEDYGHACAGFVSIVVEGRGKYPFPQLDLDEALAGARRRTRGDDEGWTWSRRSSTSPDISPLVAVTLAAWGVEHGKPRARVINLNDYA